MTAVASRAAEPEAAVAPTLGLSSRLILLTVVFMMVAEILVYIPALAGFRASWISDRIMGAQMVSLTLSAVPEGTASGELEARLVAAVKGAQAIGVRGHGTRWLLATTGSEPPAAEREIDMRRSSWHGKIRGAFRTLLLPLPAATRVIAPGPPGTMAMEWVELVLDERPLRDAMVAFSRQFFLVSLIISGVTATLLYLALHVLVVRPVKRLSDNITAFASDPEDASRIIETSGRSDEIGTAEHALARMEKVLAAQLRQTRRLADVGLGVSKINHELRNMLTTAQLLGDRLGAIEDPSVQRIAPRLIGTLGRAIDYCEATLAYGRATERPPQRQLLHLQPLVADQLDLNKLEEGHPIEIVNEVATDLVVDADPEQLGRVLLNLSRNAVSALARAKTPGAHVAFSARREGGAVKIRVHDNGPGVPSRVKGRLFSAFQASERSGGTGLGLPVAEELVRLHGGSIILEDTQAGASFCVTIPDRAAA